jgi:Icc-related predicted phosphoesterase
MLIAATGDIHSPRYYEEFVSALDRLQVRPDLLLLVGDMIERANVKEFEKINNALFGKITCPVVACFGNNEWEECREELKEKYKDIKFLDDESTVLQVGSKTVGIFGSTGSLDEPTKWQKANVPNIENVYRQRYEIADRQLQRMNVDFKILLLHYAPTYKTLEGENPRFFSSMGSLYWENLLINRKPNLVVHGHGHRGKKQAWIDTVPVFNVALPLNQEIVVIDTDKLKAGLQKFV